MVDIIIYTTEEKLIHKKGLKKGEEEFTNFYWELQRLPKRLNESERIYFATKGFIRGYFIIYDVDDSDGCTIEWNCKSWKDLKNPIPCKSFQGFKYADKVPELNDAFTSKGVRK